MSSADLAKPLLNKSSLPVAPVIPIPPVLNKSSLPVLPIFYTSEPFGVPVPEWLLLAAPTGITAVISYCIFPFLELINTGKLK